MPSTAPSPSPVQDRQPTAQGTDARHSQALDELVDMGMDMARMIHARAQAQAGPQAEQAPGPDTAPAPDLTPAFDRIARCVRRTVLLARHIAQPERPDPAQARIDARVTARRRILREVEDSIGHIATFKRLDTAALHRELLERLDSPDLDEDIASRPIPDIIEDIRRDLGLHDQRGFHPHRRRTPADLARLHARAQGLRVPEPEAPTRPDSAAPEARPPDSAPPDPNPPKPGRNTQSDDWALVRSLLSAP